jgi:subtilisin family serine protease
MKNLLTQKPSHRVNPSTIFRAKSVVHNLYKHLLRLQAILFHEPSQVICRKSAPPALDGRLFVPLFSRLQSGAPKATRPNKPPQNFTNAPFITKPTMFCLFLIFSFLIFPCATSHSQPFITPGEILVKFHNATTKPTSTELQNIAQQYGVIQIEPLTPARLTKPAYPHPFTNLYKIHLTGDPIAAAHAYSQHPNIAYAQPNHLFFPQETPNDPQYTVQFSLSNINWQTLYDALPPAQKQIIVAVLDSGVDITHEDLQANIWQNTKEANGQPNIDDDGNGYIDDIYGWDFTDAPNIPGFGDSTERDNDPKDETSHGTNISGVIAAVTNNNLGIAGIAPNAKIMPLRAGASLLAGGSFLQEDDLAAGIIYAVENGAHIINMSWGGPENAFVIRDALTYAANQGLVLVASAGNSGTPNLSFPAANNHTIAVGATDRSNALANFSSTGAAIDLVAPGLNVLTTQLNNTYTVRSGTSLSAPQVSGLAALILSRNPTLNPQQVRSLLRTTAKDLGTPGFDNSFGAGLIDAGALVTLISTVPPTVEILTPENESGATNTVNITAKITGGEITSYRLSFGIGRDPQSWTVLKSGAPTQDIQHTWNVSGLQDTITIVRLEALRNNGRTLEDRVQVHIQATAPTLSALAYGPIIDKERLTYEFRWLTDQRALGGVAIKPFGTTTFDTLYTGLVDTAHQLLLPNNLPAGPLTFQVISKGENGKTGSVTPPAFTYVPYRIPTNGYTEVGTLPDGFLSERPTDFNGDGLPEIVIMPYIEGKTFGPVKIFEHQTNGTFQTVLTTTESFLPWAIGDITNNGKDDLLGSAILQFMVYQGTNTNPFPSQRIFDLSNTWGGEIADTDGDGINNIVARSGTDRGIRILQRGNDGAIREQSFLFDPTTGTGDLGTRFVIADFDGDGNTEILTGDGDGDLWITEHRVGGYTQTWLSHGEGDTRWVGGGKDIDNDGQIEFAVARATTDSNDEFNGYWDLEIYSMIAPDQYAIEWSTRITGVAATGNGIIFGDADGDQKNDIIVCLRPDLYVFRSDAPNLYRPIWYTPVSLMHRPMLADLNANGQPEILYNYNNAIHIVERSETAFTVISPQIISARPLDISRVEIDWMQTPEATTYRIYKSTGNTPLTLLTSLSDRTIYTDTLLVENQTYRYQIAALLADGTELRSAIASVTPNKPPTVTKLTVQNATQLEILFSEPMAPITSEPSGYRINTLGHPTSVILDKNNKRALLTFAQAIPTQSATLTILKATDVMHTPIDVNLTYQLLSNQIDPAQFQRADANQNNIIDFPDFLAFAQAFNTTHTAFDFNNDGLVNFPDFITFAALFGKSLP